jgi:hypothetical protein
MKLLIMQFPSVSCHFLPLRSNILLSTLFSSTPNLCSSLGVTNQVSQPYKKIGKIMVLNILIFKFLDRRCEDKRLRTEW